ncbi:NADP-dependent oxidoreductase [Gordonia jinhuaensis]|uniref:Oxidoreductase n=1 Tax=Gordonia jinhuaensis TaxID=1517702 RepID=A0A916TCW1_9ACTN|nr:NADP-dependent oxidoreductase [Gordonia jinhuaensis]GGB40222.1 putative oxidoreductase [Gordonia jinhuaensis]
MQATHWVANGHKGLRDFAFETTEVREPGTGQVTIEVAAAGVNPADLKHSMRKDAALPALIGYEVSGTITAVGPDTEIASGPVAVGDDVLAFRIYGGYATALTVRASDVYAKPDTLPHPQAANLLLAGTTASEMLHVTQAAEGDTILLHGASGAVGVMVLQLARRAGITVIGTASKANFEKVESFGGIPVEYGHGLERRVRTAAPDGIDAALDTAGTHEAVKASLDLVDDHRRIVTIANPLAAGEKGFRAIAGSSPESTIYRNSVRNELIALAGTGDLVVPLAREFPLAEATAALKLSESGHPGGKIALVN